MAELRQNIVFYGRHFVRHLVICNPICVKFLQIMSGVISSNLKQKNGVTISNRFLRSTNAAYTHRDTDTHTHDDSIRRNAKRCISPKNGQPVRFAEVLYPWIFSSIFLLTYFVRNYFLRVYFVRLQKHHDGKCGCLALSHSPLGTTKFKILHSVSEFISRGWKKQSQ